MSSMILSPSLPLFSNKGRMGTFSHFRSYHPTGKTLELHVADLRNLDPEQGPKKSFPITFTT